MNEISKKIKKILLLILGLYFFFSSFSFATDINTTGTFSYWLKAFFDIIGAIWYILPMIAGKLLSNDLLYGTSFGMDQLLWQIWNFSRTLANFLIGFLFIWFIFKYIVSFSSKDVSILKSILPKVTISAIIINLSWFIIAVLIDISTLLIAMFGALPEYFYSSMDNSVKNLAVPKTILVNKVKCSAHDKACFQGALKFVPKTSEDIPLEKFKSYEYMISGPLMFLGHSILDITNTQNEIQKNLFQNQEKKFKGDGQFVVAIIQLFIFIMFLVPIFILIIVNIIRIFWIWIYIAFSPFLFLGWIFGFKKMEQMHKAFKFSNMIGLIFQPVFVILTFSLSFIFVLALAGGLKRNSKYTSNIKKTFMLDNSDKGVVSISVGKQESMDEFSSWIGGFFGYLIVAGLIIFLIWSLIKISFKSTEITSGIAESGFKFTENVLKTVPMPIPLGKISIGAAGMIPGKINAIPSLLESKQNQRLMKIFNKKGDIPQAKYKEVYEDFNQKPSSSIDEVFGLLEGYENESNIGSYKNVKSLIDAITEKLRSTKNPNISSIVDRISKTSDYDEKLKVILENESTIKNALK